MHDGRPSIDRPEDRARWRLWLGLIAALALAVRITYILLAREDAATAGDAYTFHRGANLLADGEGFVDPFLHAFGTVRQTAQHPPLYTLTLALPSVLGLRSVLAHQLWSCVMGLGTVIVIGLAGRRIAGPRAGLIAAGLAAIYPNVWLWDGMVLSETLGMLTTAVVVLTAYRLWDDGSVRSAAVLGVACGLGALTRAESALFLPAIMLPFVLWATRPERRRRLELTLVAGAVAGLVVAPWVVFNFTRFNHPPLGTSTNFPQTLLLTNCDHVYSGRLLGSRSYECFPGGPAIEGDETDAAERYREVGLDYIRSHAGRVPVVVAARIGRAWGVYQPLQQLRLDAFLERRELAVAQAGFAAYWVLAPAAVLGGRVLRRRGVPLTPLVAVVATVTLAVALTFGQTRYRTSAEVPIVLLAAVWIGDVSTRIAAARSANQEAPA